METRDDWQGPQHGLDGDDLILICSGVDSLRRRKRSEKAATCLLRGHIDHVLVVQPQLVSGVIWSDAFTIDHKTHLRGLHS